MVRRALDWVARAKFDEHVALITLFFLMAYNLYRTYHFMTVGLRLPPVVAALTAVGAELLFVAGGGLLLGSLDRAYRAELKKEDVLLARAGIVFPALAMAMSAVFVGVLSWQDAMLLTEGNIIYATCLAALQASVGFLLLSFVSNAYQDRRSKARAEKARKRVK